MFITKFHPRRNRAILRGPFTQAFNDPFFPNPFVNVRPVVRQNRLPIDLIEKEEEFVVRAVVPGFEADQIDISVKEDVLTQRRLELAGNEGVQFVRGNGRQRSVGSFEIPRLYPVALSLKRIGW